MDRSLLAGLAACLMTATPQPASSEERVLPFPETAKDSYKLGKDFAECAAYFQVVASVAETAEKPNSKTWAEDVSRGWRLAGLLFLAEGLAPAVKPNVESIFDTLVEVQLTEYSSRMELDPAAAMKDIRAEYDRNCVPLVPTQEAVIDVLRQNGFGAADAK